MLVGTVKDSLFRQMLSMRMEEEFLIVLWMAVMSICVISVRIGKKTNR
jgi:hypothetical protein